MIRPMLALILYLIGGAVAQPADRKLVALTFDDACLTHRTFVAPRLKAFGSRQLAVKHSPVAPSTGPCDSEHS
jgi:hypothetical protein